MAEENVQLANPRDPTVNVREMIEESSGRLDDLRKAEVRRIDDKIAEKDEKYQIQFADSKEAVVAALITTKEAITKADQANEKRFDAVNETNSKLNEQQAKLLTRTEYESNHKSLIEKIDGVESRINRTEGASNVYVTQNDLNVVVDKITELIKQGQVSNQLALQPVIAFMNSQTGKSQGISSSWGVMLGAMGLIGTILGIFAVVSRFLP
jgi:NAD-specific glutamate dehydrogenase